MIECRLLPMEKNRFLQDNPPYKKHGHYMSSRYSISGFGRTCWIVAVNICVDHEHYTQEGKSIAEIAEGCVEYLNHRPKSRYGRKRRRKPRYGAFHPKPHQAKLLTDKRGDTYIQALLITSDRSNPNFWGEGVKE